MHQLTRGRRCCATGMMTFPKPRNAIDGAVEPFKNWSWFPNDTKCNTSDPKDAFCQYHGFNNGVGACPHAAKTGVPGALTGSNGQACYWFSNGCTIGCDKCDGTNNHLGHGTQHFVYNGPKPMPAFDPPPGTMTIDPKSMQCIHSHHDNRTNTTICDVPFGARSMCGEEATTTATICDSQLRTVNTQAECGSPEDIYYYSPCEPPPPGPFRARALVRRPLLRPADLRGCDRQGALRVRRPRLTPAGVPGAGSRARARAVPARSSSTAPSQSRETSAASFPRARAAPRGRRVRPTRLDGRCRPTMAEATRTALRPRTALSRRRASGARSSDDSN
jgi:hypothetical protein